MASVVYVALRSIHKQPKQCEAILPYNGLTHNLLQAIRSDNYSAFNVSKHIYTVKYNVFQNVTISSSLFILELFSLASSPIAWAWDSVAYVLRSPLSFLCAEALNSGFGETPFGGNPPSVVCQVRVAAVGRSGDAPRQHSPRVRLLILYIIVNINLIIIALCLCSSINGSILIGVRSIHRGSIYSGQFIGSQFIGSQFIGGQFIVRSIHSDQFIAVNS
jgi:hypothetical protein